MKRNCDICKVEYEADLRNIKRGWGLCCSKSCAARKREMSKSTYCKVNVVVNNIKRKCFINTKDFIDECKMYGIF